MILRTTYTGNGQSLVEDERFYYAQNWRADVSVVLDDAGVQQERVIYSPYGQPFAMPAGDTNFDGDFESTVDGNELAAWSGDGKPYRAYGDVDLDGDVDGDDATAASEHDLGWNVLTSDGASGVNNRLGYAGYIHDRDVATAAHVRYRVYKIDLGRWTRKDPLSFLVGVNDFEYAFSAPVTAVDPSGLDGWIQSSQCHGQMPPCSGCDPCRSWSCSAECDPTWVPTLQIVNTDEIGCCGKCRFRNSSSDSDSKIYGQWKFIRGGRLSNDEYYKTWRRHKTEVKGHATSLASNNDYAAQLTATLAYGMQIQVRYSSGGGQPVTRTTTSNPLVKETYTNQVTGSLFCASTGWITVTSSNPETGIEGGTTITSNVVVEKNPSETCANVWIEWRIKAVFPMIRVHNPVKPALGGHEPDFWNPTPLTLLHKHWVGKWCCEKCEQGGR